MKKIHRRILHPTENIGWSEPFFICFWETDWYHNIVSEIKLYSGYDTEIKKKGINLNMKNFSLEENRLLPQQFCIVDRMKGKDPKVMICDNFIDACAIQFGLLVGVDTETAKSMMDQKHFDQTAHNLENSGRDRMANDEEEVYIFLMSGRNDIRHGN